MHRRRHRVVVPLLILSGFANLSVAQTSGFVPGSRELFVMDFANQPLGDTPKELRVLRGKAQIVEKEGAHMLRAAEPMEFMINLKENLPEAFTLEFDLIPKACCNPEDLSFEGTPSQSRSPSSSNVEWRPSRVSVVGGGEHFQMPMPQDLSEILPSAPTKVNVSFDASGMKLYAHDRLVATLPGRKFAHGRVLRVFLGGQDDDLYAVYLGRVRIGAGGAPSGPIANNGPTPQVSNNTSSTSSTATPTSAPSNPAATPLPGLKVTVMLGALGPVVSWPPVADATGYSVTRQKIDDVVCCNSSSGRTYISATTWQDQPPPMSGTYNYLVLANTPAGLLRGEAQLGYRKPDASATGTSSTSPTASTPTTSTPTQPTTTTTTTTPTTINGVLATTTGTVTPMTAPATGTPTTGTMVGTAPIGTINPTIVSTTGGTPSDPNGGTGAPNNVPRYRVTFTGFRVLKTTPEPPVAPDGQYDEAYVAAAVILWDRKALTVRARSDVRTREYGDVGNGTFYGTRIKAGTGSATGGLWARDGADPVPVDFDPTAATIPAPATDRFPLLVWEGPLSPGVEAVLVVPTIWDRDIDSRPYTVWKDTWGTAPLAAFFANPLVTSQMIDPQLSSTTPRVSVGVPYVITPQDAAAHVKDRPIGVFAEPPTLPAAVGYVDRHAMITQEKLASLAPGGHMTLAIPFVEPATPITGASYTLYLRIDRIQ
jgi:hypothetical protein